jgi:hypothetical protein
MVVESLCRPIQISENLALLPCRVSLEAVIHALVHKVAHSLLPPAYVRSMNVLHLYCRQPIIRPPRSLISKQPPSR